MAKAQTSQAHSASEQNFDIVIIAQAGRWQYEAALFALSLRAYSPRFSGKLYVAEPQPGPLWPKDPRINDPQVKGLLRDLEAEILPFENRYFGAPYAHGNKIEALSAMPDGRPFLFFDSDTLITDELRDVPFDFSRPSASLRVSGTWPELPLYGPDYAGIWGALYGLFGLIWRQPSIPHIRLTIGAITPISMRDFSIITRPRNSGRGLQNMPVNRLTRGWIKWRFPWLFTPSAGGQRPCHKDILMAAIPAITA
jgi:hypothetical protein